MTDSDRKARREAMLAKVRKLLAMGRDGRGNSNEQEIAMRQANKLMSEFGIAEAEADLSALDAGDMVFGEMQVTPDGKAPGTGHTYRSRPIWVGVLAVGVARFTDTLVRSCMTERGYVMVFQGEQQDVGFARWLFSALIDSIQLEQKASVWKDRASATSFRFAAAGVLQDRLKRLAAEREAAYRAAAASESHSRALVVVNRKASEIATRFGKQRISTARGGRVSGAVMAGKSAGARINIPSGRPVGSSSSLRKLT